MAEMFDRLELTGLRKAHLQQLLWYLEDMDHDRRYAGNREQFERRHEDLSQEFDPPYLHQKLLAVRS